MGEAQLQTKWEEMQEFKNRVIHEYELGYLTKLGVANALMRGGFKSAYAVEVANSLEAIHPDERWVDRKARIKGMHDAYNGIVLGVNRGLAWLHYTGGGYTTVAVSELEAA